MKYLLPSYRIVVVFLTLLLSFSSIAGETHIVEIKLENHIFTPDVIKVPKGVKIKLIVENLDPTIEEFDSPSLKREKILRSKSKTNIILAPLKEGRYEFVGEFNEDTAKGVIIVE